MIGFNGIAQFVVLTRCISIMIEVSQFEKITVNGCCCITLSVEDSHRESMRLDVAHEQAILCPLPHDERVQLHCGA